MSKLLAPAGALAVVLGLWIGVTSATSEAQEVRYEVPFLTVRDAGSSEGPSAYFGGGRGALRAGWCVLRDVDTGSLGNLLNAGPSFLREQLLQIESVQVFQPDAFLDGMQRRWTSPPALYVHGYFIDFEKGCRRASLLQDNATLGGRLMWFTWPSDGDIANYATDEADLFWSVPDIADAIIDLNRRSGRAAGIDVIGHSLGARGVVFALQDVVRREPDIRLGEIVLLAGDMDFDAFARVLPQIAEVAEGITIYVADDDRPLALSALVNGYPRLGQSGNAVGALEGVDVIDVSDLAGGTPSGHLYHIHSEQVGRDLDLLLNRGMRAADRPGLVSSGANTWTLSP
ncbi:MAG: alpha/beta hydrolase [Pseudomonadota bacterium]